MPNNKKLKRVKFVGFASGISNKRVYDVELLKQDLLNQIHTRRGERLMDPTYGSIIWDLLFEIKSEFTVNEIERDLRRIIETDPRMQLQQIQILETEHGYEANMFLDFVFLKEVVEFRVEFNTRASTRTR